MFSKIGKNDLKSFKHYLEEESETVDEMVALVRYQYAVSPMIYTEDATDTITQLNPSTFFASLSGGSSSSMMMGMTTSVFNEMMDDPEALQGQYDVLAGRWPEKYDEAPAMKEEAETVAPSAISFASSFL